MFQCRFFIIPGGWTWHSWWLNLTPLTLPETNEKSPWKLMGKEDDPAFPFLGGSAHFHGRFLLLVSGSVAVPGWIYQASHQQLRELQAFYSNRWSLLRGEDATASSPQIDRVADVYLGHSDIRKGGKLTATLGINGVRTPPSRIITPLIHVSRVIHRDPVISFITGRGAYLVDTSKPSLEGIRFFQSCFQRLRGSS